MIGIGPVGWTHPSLELLWPEARGPAFDALAFLAARFDVIEADVARHAPLRREHVMRWRASLADAGRARLTVRLPDGVLDFARPEAERVDLFDGVIDALQPILGRPQLLALVGSLRQGAIFGPAESRALAALGRRRGRASLGLIAPHPSWYGPEAILGLRGAGWALAHLHVCRAEDQTRPDARHGRAIPFEHPPTAGFNLVRVHCERPMTREEVRLLSVKISALARGPHGVSVLVSAAGPDASGAEAVVGAGLLARATGTEPEGAAPWPEFTSAAGERLSRIHE